MTIRFERPVSHAASVAHAVGRFSLVLLLAVALLHRFGLMATPYFVALVIVAAVSAALALVMALFGLWRLWDVGALGGIAAAKGLFYSLVPLAVIAVAGYAYYTRPPIYDVSTDLTSAPPWLQQPEAEQIWLPRHAVITDVDREMQLEAYPGLTGRRYDGAIDRVYEAVKKVAAVNRVRITDASGLANAGADIEDQPARPADDGAVAEAPPEVVPIPLPRPEEGEEEPVFGTEATDVLLQGDVTTLVLGLHFDVMIRLREGPETTFVDMRVASRYGQSDLGLSAAIADDYLRALDAELLGIAGG